MKRMRKTLIVAALSLMLAATAMGSGQLRFNYVPDTISPEAQKELTAIYDTKAYARVFTGRL